MARGNGVNKVLLANLAAATAALSAGAAVVATRFVIDETDPVSLSFYRYTIAVLCFVPVLKVVWPTVRIPAVDVVKIAALGALFYGFFPWAFSASLQYTTAARGAIGLATIPIQTLIVAALFGREKLSRAKLISVGLAFAGIAIVFGPEALGGGEDVLLGDALMLAGAFSAAVYSVFSRSMLGRYGPLTVTVMTMVFGVAALAPLAAAEGALGALPAFSREGWLALLFLGTIAGAIQFALFTWALRWLPPTRTVLYLTLNPISAMLLGVVVLDEILTIALVAGLGFVLAGIAVANWPARNAAAAGPAAGA